MSTRRSISWPTTSRSTSIAIASWRWLERDEAEQDCQRAELHAAGRAIEVERRADVGNLEGGAAVAHPALLNHLALVGARSDQAQAERSGHCRLRPAGLGRVVLVRVATRHRGPLPR